VLRQFTIVKNQPPEHFIKKSNLSSLGLGLHRYFDEKTNDIVPYPRHGAFEVKVNGMLIFSKIQSNLWPNIEKIGYLLAQMRAELEAGRDIQKFSLEYRLENENEDEYFVDTYKKVIKFKINRRPYSSQFNASAYVSKGSVDQTSEVKNVPFKRRNVVSLKKASQDRLELSRKS
jgi:hypothetical protein